MKFNIKSLMKKVLFGFIASLMYLSLTVAQGNGADKYFIEDRSDDPEYNIQYSPEMGSHYLGNEIAKKIYLLRDKYTYQEEGTPLNPNPKTIVRKPAIYYDILKLTKYYKKAVKKGIMTEEEARNELGHFLDIGYSAFYESTDQLEEELGAVKKPEEIIAVLKKVELT